MQHYSRYPDGTSEDGHVAHDGDVLAREGHRLGATARREGARIADVVRSEGQRLVRDQQQTAANAIRGFADAMRNPTTQEARSASAYIRPAADLAERAADRIEQIDPSNIVDELKRVSREQPAVVAVGAVAAGLLISRFLKSSRT